MSSTPPRVSSDPGQAAHQRWVEEQISALQDGSEVRDSRVKAVELSASNVGSLASSTAAEQTLVRDQVVAADSANRLARPIQDKAYWQEVSLGARFVWEVPSTVTPGMVNRSTWRNVTWDATGAFLFQPNSDIEGAEAHVTPVLPIPASKKIYVEAEYTVGLAPQIWVEWLDVNNALVSSTLATSKTVVSTAAAEALGAVSYTVKLTRPAGAGLGATREPKIFEVIGADGLAISPGGVSVEVGGNTTVEINPSLPLLAAPVAPTLTSGVGSVSVRWNGNLTSGAAPAHLAYVFAEESPNGTTGWTRVGPPLNRAGDIPTRPPVGAQRWYRLTAVDTSNRLSPVSATANITVVGVGIPDLSGDIGDVIDTVDGLNKIHYQTLAAPPTAHANGDLWFVLDGTTSIVTEVRIWNGTIWNPYRIVADSVMVPGSIGTVTIGDGVITGPKVKARSFTGEVMEIGSISVDELTPNIGGFIDITINPAIEGLQESMEQQQRYFRFGSNGLEIGDPTTNESLRLDAGRIEMVQAGNVPTYWEAQTFYVERMIVEAANIGGHRFEGYGNGRTVIRPLKGV